MAIDAAGMGTQVLGLESESSPILAELGLESRSPGLGRDSSTPARELGLGTCWTRT
jgi:hypothetical protein